MNIIVVYLFFHNNQHLVFDRKVAHVSALTGRHALCNASQPRVAGSVFKAQMMRDVQSDITGKQRRSSTFELIQISANLQTEEDLLRRASLILDYSFVFANLKECQGN